MNRGAMKCLGSLERLKAKYGDGIEVTLQTSTEGSVSRNVGLAKKFMTSTFPLATLSEERQQRLLYVLPFASIKLSDLFDTIMTAVDSGAHGIKDYTVQQSSLEQVFLRISRIGELEVAQGEYVPKSNTTINSPGEAMTNPVDLIFRSREGTGT